MAVLASHRKLSRHVVRVRSLLVILGMAGIALRRQPLELPGRGARMAGIAIQRSVCSQQRKAILVLVDLLHSYRPSLDGMALLAVGAELPLVDIGMTVRASLPHIRKNRLDVALGTTHALMQAAQRECGLVVIELGNRADRPPRCRGMAVLAGKIQIAVRTMGGALRLSPGSRTGGQKHHGKDEMCHHRRKHCAPSSKRNPSRSVLQNTIAKVMNQEETE